MDPLTFETMYSVMHNGMQLLNDLEYYLRPLGMSQARLAVLLAVVESGDGNISPKEIAEKTGKSAPGVTRMIEKLSEDGYLEVIVDKGDRRKKKLGLTGKGNDFLAKIIPEYSRRIIEISKNLSDPEKRELKRLLGKINYSGKSFSPGD